MSLSGCQHLKGKEEEGERADRGIVEQEVVPSASCLNYKQLERCLKL